MGKKQRPLFRFRFLGKTLCLKPIPRVPYVPYLAASESNDRRIPEEISVFDNIYLPMVIINGVRIADQDREEMRQDGLPTITEAYHAMVRENQAQRSAEGSRETQAAPRLGRRLLDEDIRFEEPKGATASVPNSSSGRPRLLLWWKNLASRRTPSTEILRSATPNQPQPRRDTVQNASNHEVGLGSELWDTVQTVRSADARFGNEGYRSLRSSGLEDEMEEDEIEEGKGEAE